MMTQAVKRTIQGLIDPATVSASPGVTHRQFDWIVTVKEGIEAVFADHPEVVVGGKMWWYPDENRPEIRHAPAVTVTFSRPKGQRSYYAQWQEDGVAPQVVFEVLDERSGPGDLIRLYKFFERYGVEELYLCDPICQGISGWVRDDSGELAEIEAIDGWVSPRMGIKFDGSEGQPRLIAPDNRPLLSYQELYKARNEAEKRAEIAEQRAGMSRMSSMSVVKESGADEADSEGDTQLGAEKYRTMGVNLRIDDAA
ncbi:MAG: hypothetical protein U0800_07350 [Isosphaeraceae bacterium]